LLILSPPLKNYLKILPSAIIIAWLQYIARAFLKKVLKNFFGASRLAYS